MKRHIVLLLVIAVSGINCWTDHAISKRSASTKKKQLNDLAYSQLTFKDDTFEQTDVTNKDETREHADYSKDATNTYQRVLHENDLNIDDYRTAFYGFIGLSVAAIIFIVWKSYRLRLSRAERKYGVQGDRATQELTPLPMALEVDNSDEEDQTVFDISRQQMVL